MKFGGSSAEAAAAIQRATCPGPGEACSPGVVNAIICQTGMSVVRLFVSELGILPSVTVGLSHLFERNNVTVEMVQMQPDGVSFAVESSPRLRELLRSVVLSVRIRVQEGCAVISLAGDGIITDALTLQRALTALRKAGEIVMVSQGSSQKSIRIAVLESNLTDCVDNLHREFSRAAGPEMLAIGPEAECRLLLPENAASARVRPASEWDRRPGIVPAGS